ncbi:MAG: hypothetical protein ACJ8AT_19205 [Hyalangium sp.]|uniref:hypothetical protein n=1 Tax=Hyalangium sp. TaxID=2028555 RepID=UPI00389A988D
MANRMIWFPVALALAAAGARAEGVEKRERPPSPAERIRDASNLQPMPGGGWVSVGFSTLSVLSPGARQWEKVHRIQGDSLYRVAVGGSGALLAAWEQDPSLHYFPAQSKEHLTLPQPQPPSPEVFHFHVEFIGFLPNGRDAFVFMEGEAPHMNGPYREHHPFGATYRVALDGTRPAELLYTVVGGRRIYVSERLAVFVMPKKLGQMCEHLTCNPVDQLVAYEYSDRGVTQRTLLSSAERAMSNVQLIWGSDDQHLMFEVHLGGQERGMFAWRPGEAKGAFRPFPKENYTTAQFRLLKNGDLLEVVRTHDYGDLELRRHPWAGAVQVTALQGTREKGSWDHNVHALGVRENGSLWLHWGDYLMLIPPKGPPRAYNLEPLLTRRTEWADAELYTAKPETLWVGIEHGGSRDFVRVSFDDVEKKAKPWPPR